MAWRAGAKLFREIWPLVLKHEPEGNFRREFTTDLLDLFLGCDVDPSDIQGLHPEVDQALRVANRQRIAQSGRSCHRQRIATLKVSQDRHRSCQRVAVRRSLGVQGDGCTSDASLLSWAWFQA